MGKACGVAVWLILGFPWGKAKTRQERASALQFAYSSRYYVGAIRESPLQICKAFSPVGRSVPSYSSSAVGFGPCLR